MLKGWGYLLVPPSPPARVSLFFSTFRDCTVERGVILELGFFIEKPLSVVESDGVVGSVIVCAFADIGTVTKPKPRMASPVKKNFFIKISLKIIVCLSEVHLTRGNYQIWVLSRKNSAISRKLSL